jgi:hypothetical protein
MLCVCQKNNALKTNTLIKVIMLFDVRIRYSCHSQRTEKNDSLIYDAAFL